MVFFYTDPDQANALLEQQATAERVGEVMAFSGVGLAEPPMLSDRPAVMWRQLVTPSRETGQFLAIAAALDRAPVFLCDDNDLFVPELNPYKRRLAKLRVHLKGDTYRNITIVSFADHICAKFSNILCKDGRRLVEFHYMLFRKVYGDAGRVFEWRRKSWESAREYYERTFALFTCMGILVESYPQYSYERPFFEKVIGPAFEATVSRFGCAPVIVRLLPEGEELQTEWECLPRDVILDCLEAAGQSLKIPA